MAVASPGATVVVLRALGLGDLLTAVPALRGLRRHYPGARITLAAPDGYRDLALLTGAVDDVLPTAGLGDVRPLPKPPALAVNLHGSGPESIDHLLRWRPEAVITHRHRRHPELAGPPWRRGAHEVDRWCSLLQWAGIACEPSDVTVQRPPIRHGPTGAVVIHPGASAAARRWPAGRFAAVAAALAGDGHPVVVTGSAGESDLAHDVARRAGLPSNAVLAGALDLPRLAALVADSRLVICGDTGVGHLAAATGTASVVLFGPTAPARWGPRGPAPHVALWAGGLGDPHGDMPDPGLLRIDVATVLEAGRRLLKAAA
ncbi:Lipopolysaccharide core heptosyltransferase RfaQ [Mycobacterium persicum]|uniref:Lipopolysaccharide core heptosyltransferase RfaQ n=1 Tax=Mycobacterium persicum TaxID=1487726 RepID=A0ABY6RNR1_9MYCO|nr:MULTISPECIES: glycosyltransferase family 9 protein [Mycobacterium]KZS83362.1 glycosyl transferase [Mycobacterium persicum]ORB50973.1 glycosyl transferase [Mycobacterium persicum]ORB95322.1 glycosyl transferase [Mycobacterium persicum]VAZ63180.1 Lipopolysaccharide core heptosyltransferase RfaQ [Mycobacterium kansasii]VAZ80643.1 Lipopolysaccharide core heptosyltransferase RfaQ [Mycobacterium persicum]